jgi:polyphosphate kinase 2 (PPK2 family)
MADYADRELWNRFEEAGNEMLERTSTELAPWYVIPSDRKWYRNYAISRIILRALKRLHLAVPSPRVDLDEVRKEFHVADRA